MHDRLRNHGTEPFTTTPLVSKDLAKMRTDFEATVACIVHVLTSRRPDTQTTDMQTKDLDGDCGNHHFGRANLISGNSAAAEAWSICSLVCKY